MNLEHELREALRRQPAPADFAAKVLAKTVAAPVAITQFHNKPLHTKPWWRRAVTLALAAGLILGALIPTAISEYRERERLRALEAKRELMAALAITRVQLQQARERIRRNTRHTL